MSLLDQKLSTKIVGMLLLFFVVALVAIGLTLRMSWQLEGAAGAINDGGSERMRSYRIAYLLARRMEPGVDRRQLMNEVVDQVEEFDRVLAGLEQGDPLRPLFVPREAPILDDVQAIRTAWSNRMKPMVVALAQVDAPPGRAGMEAEYRREIDDFVRLINGFVLKMEVSYAHNTNVLRSLQGGLVVLAMIGTAILISFFQVLVIKPMHSLREGMRRMAGDDFGVRLPIASRDEFGELAEGFNRMADHLENLYATLEERVESKTRSLAERNRELGLLYEIAACLSEPSPIEILCQDYLRRLKAAIGADAASVRLYVADSEELYLLVHEGLADAFVREEAVVAAGSCLCGRAMQQSSPQVCRVAELPGWRDATASNCAKAGFQTVTAFGIGHNRRMLGQFNLYFKTPRAFSRQEIQLLETLGQHLGVAVENQRLVMRDRELAVSDERNLLAQELHDSIAQGLAFLNLQVQLLGTALERGDLGEAEGVAAQIREGVQESYDDVRELLVHFRTRVIQNDLEGTLRTVLKKFEAQTGVKTGLGMSGGGAPLSPEAEVQILHIVQESLSNIRKHARATAVDVKLVRGPAGLTLTVRDDGIGFDPEAAATDDSDNHVGLKIMRERCHRIGGELTVRSHPGRGVEVALTLPGREAA